MPKLAILRLPEHLLTVMSSHTNARPLVSFVIRTYFRVSTLIKVLESIANLDYPKDRIEVIVVVDKGDADAIRAIEVLGRDFPNSKLAL